MLIENEFSHINSLEAITVEKKRVQARLDRGRRELSLKMYEIPAELAAAGVNTIIPSFLKGKVTNAALNGGKKLINRFMVPEENNRAISGVSKGISLIRGLKKVYSLWKGRK